jgi:hypothetical protein
VESLATMRERIFEENVDATNMNWNLNSKKWGFRQQQLERTGDLNTRELHKQHVV